MCRRRLAEISEGPSAEHETGGAAHADDLRAGRQVQVAGTIDAGRERQRHPRGRAWSMARCSARPGRRGCRRAGRDGCLRRVADALPARCRTTSADAAAARPARSGAAAATAPAAEKASRRRRFKATGRCPLLNLSLQVPGRLGSAEMKRAQEGSRRHSAYARGGRPPVRSLPGHGASSRYKREPHAGRLLSATGT